MTDLDIKHKHADDKTVPSAPPKRSVKALPAVVIPSVDMLINDAVSIIGSELASYKHKIATKARLDPSEARIIRDYVNCLVMLSKESREIARADDLSSLSNEELMELAAKLVTKNLEPGKA